MQNISNVPEDARAKMEFKDELTDEFDDMKDELVKDEFDSEGISIKSPIGKDAFDIVDEFISDNEGQVKINGAEQSSEFGLTEDEEEGREEKKRGGAGPRKRRGKWEEKNMARAAGQRRRAKWEEKNMAAKRPEGE